jgi:putative flippase GtrA
MSSLENQTAEQRSSHSQAQPQMSGASRSPHIKDYFTREFIMFFVCNTLAAGVNFGSRILFNKMMPYEPSIFFAFCCGLLTAFTLNKLFVFDAKHGKTGRQLFGFVVVNILGLAQILLFSLLFRDLIFPRIGFTFHPDAAAHIIGISVPVFTSFLGHKYFSFRK